MSTLYALPIGNTSSPALYNEGLWDRRDPIFSWGKCTHLRFGYYGDFVFDRQVENIVSGNPEGDIERMTIHTNAGTITLDVCNYLDLYILAGASKIGYDTDGAFGEYTHFNFSTTTCWSLGGVLDLWECGCFGIGIEGQYFQVRPKLNNACNLATGQLTYFNNLNKMMWREWQGGIGANYSFYNRGDLCITSYLGAKAATGKLWQHSFQFDEGGLIQTLNSLETRKLWGFALGITAISSGTLGVTVEGRWADENALYTNMQLSY